MTGSHECAALKHQPAADERQGKEASQNNLVNYFALGKILVPFTVKLVSFKVD